MSDRPQLENYLPSPVECETDVAEGYLLYEPRGPDGAWIESDVAIDAEDVA